MGRFAVIDTETNWADQVMSIGTVIADTDTFSPIDAKYHILDPEYQIGGMFSDTLFMECRIPPVLCSREDAISDLAAWFQKNGITGVFAYNAAFDRNHLPEFRSMQWFDIMRLAAYRQHNPRIPCTAECFSTGRMKRGYGVEAMLRLLTGQSAYCETHNAIMDAFDELQLMCLLGHCLSDYIPL